MKCKNCGAELNLEDPYCRYCGAPNEFAQQHIRDMQHYQGDFEETKADVYRKNNSSAGIAVRIIITAVLCLAIIITWMLGGSSYSVYRWKQRSTANKNYQTFSAQMDAYLEQGDYEAFDAFCKHYGIYGYWDSKYESYSNLISAANHYSYIVETIREIVTPDSYGSRYNEYKSLSDLLTSFYKYDFPDTRDSYEELSDTDKKYIYDMQENISALLIADLGLSQEEAEQLKDLSESQRARLIEGKYHEESETESEEQVD